MTHSKHRELQYNYLGKKTVTLDDIPKPTKVNIKKPPLPPLRINFAKKTRNEIKNVMSASDLCGFSIVKSTSQKLSNLENYRKIDDRLQTFSQSRL